MTTRRKKHEPLYCCNCGKPVEAEWGNCPNCGGVQVTNDENLALLRLRQSSINKKTARSCVFWSAVMGAIVGGFVGIIWGSSSLSVTDLVRLGDACQFRENVIVDIVQNQTSGAGMLAGIAAGALGAVCGTRAFPAQTNP